MIYYNARYYVPYLNRFLTSDSIVPDPTDPQSYNRYTYARNNPLRFTDPTGHFTCEGDSCIPNAALPHGPFSYPPQNWPPFTIEHPLVESPTMLQWFGNTLFALERGYTAYCGYTHCGLDFMASKGTPVYAGVKGTVVAVYCPTCMKKDKNGNEYYEASAFGPWRVDVQVIGNDGRTYTIIYGHLDGNFDFDGDGVLDVYVDQKVTPETRIGSVGADENGVEHLHFEITDWQYTYNPLPFFMPDLRNSLVELAMYYQKIGNNPSGVNFVSSYSDFLDQPWRICRRAGTAIYMTCP